MKDADLAWLNELQTNAELLVVACKHVKEGHEQARDAIALCARRIAEHVLPQDLKYNPD